MDTIVVLAIGLIIFLLAMRRLSGYEGVLPESPATFAGDEGGPFMPSAFTYTLYTGDDTSSYWWVDHSVPWITVWPESGRTPRGGNAEILVMVNGLADALGQGAYLDTLEFQWRVLRGDMDGNAIINTEDVPGFVAVALGIDTDTTRFSVADIIGDGRVDGRDVLAMTAKIIEEPQ